MGGIIQIAGVRDKAEALLIAESGVDWIGFPFRLDHHAEDLSETEASAIIKDLSKRILPVLITYLSDVDTILELGRALGTRAVQLHGAASPEVGMALKAREPDLVLIRSLVIRGQDLGPLESEAEAWAVCADYFLTDTFDPVTGASGATGKTHDWELSRRLAETVSKPMILAGGLSPSNVGAAIRKVHPAGVDAHTGVEDAQGRKDPELLRRFVGEARAAFLEIG